MKALFRIGRPLITPAASDTLAAAGVSPATLILRHMNGDWGDKVDGRDTGANRAALRSGERIFSAYTVAPDKHVYVITEAVDELGQRAATTILLPEDY